VNCPICTQPLDGGELVMVCNGCHKALGGGLDVGSTGEFRVPSTQELMAHAAESESIGTLPTVVDACSWCGKLELQVKKLLGRGGVALCDECVALCCDILDAELGTTWR
jgi:hypothetical protein